MTDFNYSGRELDIFSSAENWKNYWSKIVRKYLGFNVLEVGAGIGTNSKILFNRENKRWVALEPDRLLCDEINKCISKDNALSSIEVISGTLSNLSPNELFDTILYIDVLEHIENDFSELSKAHSHLTHNGNIVVVAPAHNFLFTPFDKKIGHYRRYNKKMLRAIVPPNCSIVDLRYLDSVGILASLANKVFLKSDSPSLKQVLFWDKFMVRSSLLIDKLFGFLLGKTIICVLKRND